MARPTAAAVASGEFRDTAPRPRTPPASPDAAATDPVASLSLSLRSDWTPVVPELDGAGPLPATLAVSATPAPGSPPLDATLRRAATVTTGGLTARFLARDLAAALSPYLGGVVYLHVTAGRTHRAVHVVRVTV